MSDSLVITSGGVTYPYIKCIKYNGINGQNYFDDVQKITVNESNVQTIPITINDKVAYDNYVYQVGTLGACRNGEVHVIDIRYDCEFNFVLIGPGSCGGIAYDNTVNSVPAGGASGGVVSGKINLKAGNKIKVYIDGTYGVDTIKYMGKDKPYQEVVNNPPFYMTTGNNKQNSWMIIETLGNSILTVAAQPFSSTTRNNPRNYSTSGWNIKQATKYSTKDIDRMSRETLIEEIMYFLQMHNENIAIYIKMELYNLYTNEQLRYLLNSLNNAYINNSSMVSLNFPLDRGSFQQYEGMYGGMSQNVDFSDKNFGLASGFENEITNSPYYPSINILGREYLLPSGGGGGGGNTTNYNYNYNSSVNSYSLSNQGCAGVGIGGGGFGNRINIDNERRLIDAWMPGAGGGGAYSGNKGAINTNGVGGQGCLLYWAKQKQ